MKTWNDEGRTTRRCLILLVAVAVFATCASANAQLLIGSSGAGWQNWSVVPISSTQPDLNDNGAPWWDLQWEAVNSNYSSTAGADKNPGFCMTATGDCVGMASGAFAPGAIPFWGMPYDPVADDASSTSAAPGLRDNTVYFRSTGGALVATLYLNATAIANEINDFGWFETNSTGTVSGAKHKLFSGTGVTKDQLPTPTGTAVTFTPTRYFGFYYSDVSEPACPDGTDTGNLNPQCGDATLPTHGCYAYSVFWFNDQKCVNLTGNQGDHDFVVFSANARNTLHPTFWIAGEDPADCKSQDGDCNLTLVRLAPAARGGN